MSSWWSMRHTPRTSASGQVLKLALEDAICLASALAQFDEIPTALSAYGEECQEALRQIQREAQHSARWFENVPSYIGLNAEQFTDLMHQQRSPVLPYLPPKVYLGFRWTLDRSCFAQQVWGATPLPRNVLQRPS